MKNLSRLVVVTRVLVPLTSCGGGGGSVFPGFFHFVT